MPQRVLGQAYDYRLLAGDHAKLVVERPGERIPVNSGRWSHARIMALGSDKPAARDWPRAQPVRWNIGPVISAPMFHRVGAGWAKQVRLREAWGGWDVRCGMGSAGAGAGWGVVGGGGC